MARHVSVIAGRCRRAQTEGAVLSSNRKGKKQQQHRTVRDMTIQKEKLREITQWFIGDRRTHEMAKITLNQDI